MWWVLDRGNFVIVLSSRLTLFTAVLSDSGVRTVRNTVKILVLVLGLCENSLNFVRRHLPLCGRLGCALFRLRP